MIVSKRILPIRIYDNLFEQDRFNNYHDRRFDSPLVYPINALPHFQFSRTSSVLTTTNFIVRKVCNVENYEKAIPEGASNFEPISATDFFGSFPKVTGGVYDNGVDPPSGVSDAPVAILDGCNKLSNANTQYYNTYNSIAPVAEISFPTLGGLRHKFKIIVEKFENNSGGFSIKVLNGVQGVGPTLLTITAPGIYTLSFTAASTQLSVVFDSFDQGDIFSISQIQAEKDPLSTLSFGDITLDEGDIRIKKKSTGEDSISFCSNSTTFTAEPGDYYYIIDFGTETYYSEVFTLKSLKDIEKYYLLEWWNTCDLGGVHYNATTLQCSFRNKLYLDAALFKPEYTTRTENQENGEGEETPTLKRWEKYINLEIIKSPEFLTDALSAIFLHDNISFVEPLNKEQVFQSQAYSITKIIPEISQVLEDSYQRVLLKFLMSGSTTKTNCCDNFFIVSGGGEGGEGYPADYVVGSGYSLTINDPPENGDGLYDEDENLIAVEPGDIIKDGADYFSLELVEESEELSYYIVSRTYPEIISSGVDGDNYIIEGCALPFSYVQLSVNKDAGGFEETDIVVEANENGEFSLEYPTSEAVGLTTLSYRVENYDIDGSFGVSEEFEQTL